MRYKTVFNSATNTQTVVPLTAEEEAQRDAEEAALAAMAVANAQTDADAAALKAQIVTIAQTAVGVRVDLLTAAQVRALVAMLLNRAGAIAADLTIRPLADWA